MNIFICNCLLIFKFKMSDKADAADAKSRAADQQRSLDGKNIHVRNTEILCVFGFVYFVENHSWSGYDVHRRTQRSTGEKS
jgi:hypothetical protein